MKIVHDEELFNTINDMWDKYHLKKDVPQNELSNLKTLLEKNTLDYDVEQSLISQDIANVLNLDISKEPADDLEM